MAVPKPVMLMVLDGFGVRAQREGNAIALADTPFLDRLLVRCSHVLLQAAGEAVGLPEGQMGNSEVGHTNLGAGRVVDQEVMRITRAIRDGHFYENEVLIQAIQQARQSERAVHLLGLLSDGGVHSHIDHLFALLELCRRLDQQRVFIHAFLDGRDVPPRSAARYLAALQQRLDSLGFGQIASIAGRYYAMDRDRRWDRTQKAYRAIVDGEGEQAETALAGLQQSYDRNQNDEFVVPTVLHSQGSPAVKLEEGDTVIFFNFRPDRAIQLSQALHNTHFEGFERPHLPVIHFVTMTFYSETIDPCPVAFPPEELHDTLGEVLARNGKRQLRIAETEKFKHVTSFLNGGREEPFEGEERILIPSPKVATYDQQPEMSAEGITDAVINAIRRRSFDFICLNFANADMVGHTGDLKATIAAIETLDRCIARIVQALDEVGGVALITGDHGNAEIMFDPQSGQPKTAHTTSPVPLIVTDPHVKLSGDGILADVAPTILDLMHLQPPKAMTGHSLLVENGGQP